MEVNTADIEIQTDDTETQLITYLKNILKCQIIPMNFMNLRDLVEEAPKKMKLYAYVQEKYPDVQFLEFLRRHPLIFTVNPNRTVILTEGNNFTLPYMNKHQQSNKTYDEVDSCNKKEYVSASDSSDSEEDNPLNEEGNQVVEIENSSGRFGTSRHRNVSPSSSISESSVDVFSSEIVQTSDSAASSFSSNSSLDKD